MFTHLLELYIKNGTGISFSLNDLQASIGMQLEEFLFLGRDR